MYFDALTLAAVADELRATVLDGRIQRVLLPSSQSVALEIYAHGRRHHLLLSCHPQLARAHLTTARPSRGVEGESPLLLLLRKYVLGGRIVAIDQPDLERVLILSIVKGPLARNTEPLPDDEDADDGLDDLPDEPLRCELIVEVMDRRSNLVLVGDDNVIKESLRHVTPLMSRRPVQPREPYELPPRQDKLDPRRASAAGLRGLLDTAAGDDLARALVGRYRGLSPQLAREAVFRAAGQAAVPVGPDLPWEALAEALRGLFDGPWQPALALGGDGPLAYAPYTPAQFERVEPQPSISVALETFYAGRERLTSHSQRREALAQALGETRERLDRQRRQLAAELEQAKELERLRWEGEMIYAFLHTVQPGQATLEVDGRTIALDPKQTPVENAQARFRAYDKAKGAAANLPELLRATEARIAGVDEVLALLALADSYEQIEDIGREVIELGLVKNETGRKRAKVRRQPPLRIESRDGLAIYVGRSAGQNEQVTFKIGASDDLWLHVRQLPGAHVIIKSGGEAPEQTILEAAALAAYFSSARGDAQVEVDVSRRRLVRRIPGGPPGLVSYRAERTVRVAPRAP